MSYSSYIIIFLMVNFKLQFHMFSIVFFFFFFNDTATTEIYTLSLHDALPICSAHRSFPSSVSSAAFCTRAAASRGRGTDREDRKSTRLNSSHSQISYAVFCLKKKKKKRNKE